MRKAYSTKNKEWGKKGEAYHWSTHRYKTQHKTTLYT